MILCLDSGNTRLKWGLYAPAGGWLAHGAVAQPDLDALGSQLQSLPIAERVVGCNVAGEAQAAQICRVLGRPVEWFSASAAAGGVVNAYTVPAQLGADRWASLIAVREMYVGAALVVSAGTATTIDMLTADGNFCGGIILPGISLMRAALAENTAQLPLAQATYTHFPHDTASAIVAGVLEAQAGAIGRMFERLPGAGKRCFLGGGAAADIEPLLALPLTRVDDMVLRGVGILARDSV